MTSLHMIILLLLISAINTLLVPDLIKSYFRYKYVNYGTVFGCFEKKSEQIKLAKNLMTQNFSLSVFNIEDIHFNINDTVKTKHNERLGIVLDGDCRFAGYLLDEAGISEIFTNVRYWLVFLTSKTIEELFSKVLMTISTDLKVAIPIYNGDNNKIINQWIIYDVYNQAANHNGKLKYNFYHIYQQNKPLMKWKPFKSLYMQRRNMSGVTFRSIVVLPKKFSGTLEEYLVNDEKREDNSFNRFQTVLIYHIRDFYQFSLNMSWTESWGYKLPNGSFDGMVRALEHKLIDFGSSPLFVKNERLPVLDYGRRSWLLRSAFIFQVPKRPASMAVFLRPLHGNVWSVTVFAVIIIVFLLKIIQGIETSRFRHFSLNNFESSWSFLSLFTLGALCQQGASDSPNSVSSRTLFIFVFIFGVLLYQFYSASIVSILLMTPARIIKDLKDLAHSNLKLGVEDVLYNRDYIGKLQFDPVVRLLEKKAPTKGNVTFYCEPEVGLKLVAAGGYAYHVEVATAYPIIEKTFDEDTVCSLGEVQLFRTQQMHAVLQKHSPFREMLDHVLHKIGDTGLMKRQLKHWHARKPECIRSRPPTSPVSIEEFYPALIILLMGIFASILILMIEKFLKFRREKLQEINEKHSLRNIHPYNQ